MLKARSRKISLVLVLAMLMTMFAGLGVANAATGYSASHVPLVSDGPDKDLGAIIVSFDNLPGRADAGFIVKLPSDFKLADDSLGTYAGPYLLDTSKVVNVLTNQIITIPDAVYDQVQIVAVFKPGDNQAIVKVTANALISELKFAINLNGIEVPTGAPEAINATLIAQPGSVFADGIVQVAKTGGAAVTALAGDAITVTGSGSDPLDPAEINFRENKVNALKEGANSFTLKLPKGFGWDPVSFKTITGEGANEFFIDPIDDRTLKFYRYADDEDVVVGETTTYPGAAVQEAAIWKLIANITVDESVAQFGDITVTIGGASNISPSSVVIGKYADYGVDIVVDDPETEVIAGRHEQYVSDFAFKENIADSLLDGRTIYVELPDGVKWDGDNDDVNAWLDTTGDLDATTATILENDAKTLKIVIGNEGDSKGNIEINGALVKIAGNFTGDITAKIWGNAGLSDEIVLAKAIAPVSVTADIEDIKIGLQKQVGGNIVITEAVAEGITTDSYWLENDEDVEDYYDENADTFITVTLPYNVYWGDIPTVKVIEGDIDLGTVSTSYGVLTIPVDNSSSVASKIEISDVTYTVDRTVPEGEMKATFAGSALVQTYFTNKNYITKEVVANCVTPAPGETIGSGEFRIGSNIYYEGGVAKVMDVAPYIKDSRTYVPMRYLGEILGAEVVWDDAARTVTLTKGDTTVVFTIGSTSYTVNGEAKTADVAPEIASDRTMLPARFVAEAFGAVVGWDAATQTVLIQK